MPKTGNLLGDVWTKQEDQALLDAMYEVKELKGHHAVLVKKNLANDLSRSEKAVTLRWMRLLIRYREQIFAERKKRGLGTVPTKRTQSKTAKTVTPAAVPVATEPVAAVETTTASTNEFQQTIQFLHKAATTHEKLMQAVQELLSEVERQRANAVWYKAQAEQAQKERDDLVNAFALATKIVTEGDETLSRIRKLNIDRMGVVG